MSLLVDANDKVKIADVGNAVVMDDPSRFCIPPSQLRTQDGDFHQVTLGYRAPEICLGEDRFDTSVGIWSLGCVFSELLKRKLLFDATNEIGVINQSGSWGGLQTMTVLQPTSVVCHTGAVLDRRQKAMVGRLRERDCLIMASNFCVPGCTGARPTTRCGECNGECAML